MNQGSTERKTDAQPGVRRRNTSLDERAGAAPQQIAPEFIDKVIKRLAENRPIRLSLPMWGCVHMDRQLPFLCVYRQHPKTMAAGTERLVTSEASYLLGSGKKQLQAGLSELIQAIARTLVAHLGACLILELWAGPPLTKEGQLTHADLTPGFRIVAPRGGTRNEMTDELVQALGQVEIGKRKANVATTTAANCAPPGLPSVMPGALADEIGCHVYGLEVTPVYTDATTATVFPSVLRVLRRKLTVALRQVFFHFACQHSTHQAAHYHALGQKVVVKAVWHVDRLLSQASEQFDFLLQLTPVNTEQAWNEFRQDGYARVPAFHYRPLPAEPLILKRNLYKAPVERVEDPTLAQIFREKLDELDRQITMLVDRNTTRFLHESIQLYGNVEDELYRLATDILSKVPPSSQEPTKDKVTAEQFAMRAREEIEHFRQQNPDMGSPVPGGAGGTKLPQGSPVVEVRDDVASLMVTRGNLLISSRLKIASSRLEALIQHEVGTHVLTYHNGRAQRLQLVATGFAGYDAFQEGLAVLSEYLVGGLSGPRLRLLAARVVAAGAMIQGANFVETFRELTQEYHFGKRTAFDVAVRIYRGGGLTKDIVYLRGLSQILRHLGHGGDLKPLLIGKIAVHHIPSVRELQFRGILADPPLLPSYLNDPDAQARLEKLREGMTVLDLIEKKPKKRL